MEELLFAKLIPLLIVKLLPPVVMVSVQVPEFWLMLFKVIGVVKVTLYVLLLNCAISVLPVLPGYPVLGDQFVAVFQLPEAAPTQV